MAKRKAKSWNAQSWAVPDLTSILHDVAATYWPDCLALPIIVWSYPNKKSNKSVTYGWYRPRQKFIYVSLVLSQPWVPEFVLRFIVYHELCHFMQDVLPVKGEPVHSKRFSDWEARMPDTPKACAWLTANIDQFIHEQNRLVRHASG
jgi:hypothetical protein